MLYKLRNSEGDVMVESIKVFHIVSKTWYLIIESSKAVKEILGGESTMSVVLGNAILGFSSPGVVSLN